MFCYVYILKLKSGLYYTGITKNLEQRLKEHSSRKCISTRNALPAKLIWSYKANSRRFARRLEVKIKNMGASRFLRSQVVAHTPKK